MADDESSRIELISVDEMVLEQLVEAAVTASEADEVTPPLTSGKAWTETRVAWLREYHRRCRHGLTGSAGEATWAVVVDQEIVGSVRLKTTDEDGVLETGIWLTRRTRGRGIGRMALSAVLREALRLGAREVRADTTVNNTAALALLRAQAFTTTESGGGVRGRIRLDPGPPLDATQGGATRTGP